MKTLRTLSRGCWLWHQFKIGRPPGKWIRYAGIPAERSDGDTETKSSASFPSLGLQREVDLIIADQMLDSFKANIVSAQVALLYSLQAMILMINFDWVGFVKMLLTVVALNVTFCWLGHLTLYSWFTPSVRYTPACGTTFVLLHDWDPSSNAAIAVEVSEYCRFNCASLGFFK